MSSSTRAAVVADPAGTLLALDFDGTLAHIVDDPTHAFAHPRSVAALRRLGGVLGQVAIITGRPVRQALELGGFAGLSGLETLVICGQYGAERWDAATGEVREPSRPGEIERLAAELPAWLELHRAGHVRVEDKGLALALHTRGIDPGLLDVLADDLALLATEHGLTLEPGKQVMELRAPGIDKGDALLELVHARGSRQVVFAGDDLGDLPAFDAVDALRREGVRGLLLCSESTEEVALSSRADVVLAGPDAVADWLEGLADELAGT